VTVYAYSSFSYSYLNRARVLAKTLKAQHPDWKLWAVVTDEEPESFSFDIAREEFDGVLAAKDLLGADFEPWLFGHDVVEACTAVKGPAAVRLLEFDDCEKLFFFDPDMAVFNGVDDVVDLLSEYSIVLTPHQTEPEERWDTTAIRDNEITSLEYGAFNLGFFAIANDNEGRRFALWWGDRLREWCHDRRDIGLFVDQKWCNLVPCFFDRVKVLRDPGYNVASWNLSQRVMRYDDAGTALVNDRPLRFFHFTKLGAVGDVMTQRYARDNIEVYELWWWYRQEVHAATSREIPKSWWAYGTFDNGEAIPKRVRELYRERRDLREAFPRPFGTGNGSFHEWLTSQNYLGGSEGERGFVPV